MRHLAAALTTCFLAAAPAAAQSNLLQINEVNYTTNGAPDQWIEIANFSAAPFDLSNWSIYQATLTSGRPGNYWWGFPAGTTVPAASNGVPGFLRVFWLRSVTANVGPNEINTGDQVFHFLFGLFAEPLARESGALALVDSQNNGDMNSASRYLDFVAWGTAAGTFRREDLAAQNGRWQFGARAAAPAVDQSLAFISFNLTEPSTPAMFFRDRTPSPGKFNHMGESLRPYGSNCVLGEGQPSSLTANSIPASGNADFAFVVDQVVPNQTIVGLLFGVELPNGLPWFQTPCRIWIDPALPFVAVGLTASTDPFTYSPPSPPNFGNSPPIALQAVVGRVNGTSFSNGMVVQFGMQAP